MLHQIGVGALGPVFRTYEPNRDRLVAVKVFRLDVTPEQAAALAEELGRAANAGLFHSSIVEPVAAGVEGTVAYRAEEYVAAESLDVAMRHYAPATLDKALPFITQLASAIDFAREAGVGHGALHPRDIFVTPDEARATGFGVVDALERVGQRAPVRRPYSPPERIAGQSWNTSADVFSLAAISFELLTGRRPSGLGENMGSLSGATLGDHADEIRAVLARGMNEKPAERYATARAFSAALAKAAAVEEATPSLADRTIVVAPAAGSTDPDLRIVSDLSAPGSALADLSLAASLTTTPAASDMLIKDAAVSVAGGTEAAGDGLDDFGAEPESLSSAESPREIARKMIAAREVRKRQVKKKPERLLNDLASEARASDALNAESNPDIESDIRPYIQVQAEIEAASDSMVKPEAEVAPAVEVQAKVPPPVPAPVPVIASGGLFDRSEPEPVPADDAAPKLREVKPAAVSTDVSEVLSSLPISAAELTPALALEPAELAPPPRDYSDRVVAVDEFRARESSASKSDRAWQRIPDRPLNERPALEREPVRRLKDEDFDSAILPPPAYEESPEGQRPLVLQGALLASLCLMLGFGLGYVYRDRMAGAAAQPTVVNSPVGVPRDEQQAPTSGKTPVPGTDVDVPVGGAKPAPPPAAPAPAAPNPKPAPPAAVARKAVPSAGRVVVTSTPAKAGVTVNGKWSGRTPLTLDDVKFGKYVVRIVQPGYEVVREQFVLSPSAATKNVTATLRHSPGASRAPAAAAAPVAPPKTAASQAKPVESAPKPAVSGTGILVIDSRPQGARVFVDGKDFGFTPLRLMAQPVGDRAVRLELANHHPWTNTAKVTAGEPTHVTGSLEPIR